MTKEFLEKQSPQYNSQFETSTKNITDYEINNYSDLEEANEVSSFFNDYFSEQISKKQASSNTNHKINLDIFSSDDNKILVLQFSLYDFSNQNKLSEWGKSYFLQKK